MDQIHGIHYYQKFSIVLLLLCTNMDGIKCGFLFCLLRLFVFPSNKKNPNQCDIIKIMLIMRTDKFEMLKIKQQACQNDVKWISHFMKFRKQFS